LSIGAPKAAVLIVVRNMNVHQYDSGRFPDSDFRSGQVVGPTLSHLLSHGDDVSDRVMVPPPPEGFDQSVFGQYSGPDAEIRVIRCDVSWVCW